MDQLSIIDISAGVLIGNALTLILVICLREVDKSDRKGLGWDGVSGWVAFGIAAPCLFAVSRVYLEMTAP